jgi:hypothetical protein
MGFGSNAVHDIYQFAGCEPLKFPAIGSQVFPAVTEHHPRPWPCPRFSPAQVKRDRSTVRTAAASIAISRIGAGIQEADAPEQPNHACPVAGSMDLASSQPVSPPDWRFRAVLTAWRPMPECQAIRQSLFPPRPRI